MTISSAFKASALAIACSAQALMGGLLPFHSTFVQPYEFIVHIERAAWVDQDGKRLELLSQPIDVDIMKNNVVDLSDSLALAAKLNFFPVTLDISMKRFFDLMAEGDLNDTKNTHLHTQTGLPPISVQGVDLLTLATNDASVPMGLQRCFFPKSTQIDDRLREGHIAIGENMALSFSIPYDAAMVEGKQGHILLELRCPGIEFGDSMFGAPYFVLPYLPYMQLTLNEELMPQPEAEKV